MREPVYPHKAAHGWRWAAIVAAVVLAVAVASLNGCTLQGSYVAADKLTYDGIALPYVDYFEADETLTDVAKDRRRALVESWAARIAEAETGTETNE